MFDDEVINAYYKARIAALLTILVIEVVTLVLVR